MCIANAFTSSSWICTDRVTCVVTPSRASCALLVSWTSTVPSRRRRSVLTGGFYRSSSPLPLFVIYNVLTGGRAWRGALARFTVRVLSYAWTSCLWPTTSSINDVVFGTVQVHDECAQLCSNSSWTCTAPKSIQQRPCRNWCRRNWDRARTTVGTC